MLALQNNIYTLFDTFGSKPGDTSNFTDYPDSDKLSPEVPKKDDPFLDWWAVGGGGWLWSTCILSAWQRVVHNGWDSSVQVQMYACDAHPVSD